MAQVVLRSTGQPDIVVVDVQAHDGLRTGYPGVRHEEPAEHVNPTER